MSTKFQLIAFFFLFILPIHRALGKIIKTSCDTDSSNSSAYICNKNDSENHCNTFAVFRTNSYYSSVFNLTSYLGIDPSSFKKANAFSSDEEIIPKHQPILIPIECKCNGVTFEAVLTKTATKGENFFTIAKSLEGLTTCKAIESKNPSVKSLVLSDKKVQLSVPIICACPSSSDLNQKTKFLLSYPVTRGDTIFSLGIKFNVTPQAIVLANSISRASFNSENLIPFSTIFIPLQEKPILNLEIPTNRIPTRNKHKKMKFWLVGVYVGLSVVIFGSGIGILGAILVNRWKKKKEVLSKATDLELQQLSLSIRTTSEKKVSFDRGSQDTLDGQVIESTTPRYKMLIDIYNIDDIKRATENFNSVNLIEESVFHGRLNGKDLAIKCAKKEIISRIDFRLFHDTSHIHPNLIRLIGMCSTEGNETYLVFEYAKNGSLKDWIHGGLAIKSQFISSCYCFLNWKQRLKICLDVATALQYMHQVMIPSYVHKNIKSRNIFLDDEFNAKIGNFGLEKCDKEAIQEKTHSSSSTNWNEGYLAPEYLENGIISPSIDIFAFGVVLLEVLSGKTPITVEIKSILETENAEELRGWMDNGLGENYSFDGAVTLANLARACVDDDPSLRPSAGKIVEKLSRLVEEVPDFTEQFLMCESSVKPLVKKMQLF